MDNIGKKIFKIPKIIKRSLAFLMNLPSDKTVSKILRNTLLKHRFIQLREVLKDDSWKEIYEKFLHTSKNYEIASLLGYRKDVDEKSFAIGEKDAPMQGMMLWDYHRYMVDDILTKVDRATMSVSIEGREPLLDHRIAEFMAQVPFEYKYKNGESKYLLRKVLERYIPKEMIDRPKKGFGIPMFEWFSSDLKILFDTYFKQKSIEKHGLLNFEYIEQEYKKLKNDKVSNVNKLWYILVFEMWYKKYMDKN